MEDVDPPEPLSTSRHSHIHFPVSDRFDASSTPDRSPATKPSPVLTASQHLKPSLSAHHARTRVRSEVPAQEQLRPRRATTLTMTHPHDLHPQPEGSDFLSLVDEYDLYPRILQDVERALRLKAQREARVRAKHTSLPSRGPLGGSPATTPAGRTSFQPFHFQPIDSSSARAGTSFSSIDFGPAITGDSYRSHPIPTSIDDGRTLDWSRATTEERGERRWSLSISKKRSQDGPPSLARTADQIHKLEKLYNERITGIKRKASPLTVDKANVARDQLLRRYNIINQVDAPLLNPLEVLRWFQLQRSAAEDVSERVESFQSVGDRRKDKATLTRRWCISTRIIEQFLQAQGYQRPETPGTFGDPSSLSMSLPDPSRITFDSLRSLPQTDPDVDLPTAHGYPSGSYTVSSVLENGPLDIQAPDITVKSPSNSPVESPHPPSSPFAFPPLAASSGHLFDSAENLTAGRRSADNLHPAFGWKLDASHVSSSNTPSSGRRSPNTLSGSERSRVNRMSLPIRANGNAHGPSLVRPNHVDEHKLAQSYDCKARLLEGLIAQNHRNRQLLHRISAGVREYDALQSAASKTVGLEQLAIPRDLLDSFSHDPAVVTGSTRRYQGWRAVEDIRNRLVRQRKVFQNFIRQARNQENYERRNILDDPIASLLRSLKTLQQHKTSIVTESQKVAQKLKSVKVVHQDVKDAYNKTLSYTSVVYPELSHLVALEESFKDQYQQIWEFAMSTLTLILDGVTPVWRTYGKTIGEDIRDFLIIPLYRNEFTGEARRYQITAFPKRSYRHWIALLLFFAASLFVMTLQVRAASSSLMHYMLYSIPYEGFRWTILPLFWIMIVVQWVFCVIEFFIVSLQVGTIAWWIGWSVRIVS